MIFALNFGSSTLNYEVNSFIVALKEEIPIDLTPEHSGLSHDQSNGQEEEEEDETDLNDSVLMTLETELTDLKYLFDKSVMEKHNIQKTCQMLVTKLKLARSLLEK